MSSVFHHEWWGSHMQENGTSEDTIVHHTEQHAEQTTIGPPPPEPNEVSFRWSGKSVAIAVGICTLAGSFFTFTAVQYASIAQERAVVEMRIKSLEDWRTEMTQIARDNTEARIRNEEQLKNLQQGQMDIKDMLNSHMHGGKQE